MAQTVGILLKRPTVLPGFGLALIQRSRRLLGSVGRTDGLYGVILSNARAMGEFGAVSVVSDHIRGLTNTIPLHVEILYNEYNFTAAFAVASLLALLALALRNGEQVFVQPRHLRLFLPEVQMVSA